MSQPKHFYVLDSWRGISALMVVLFHFDVNSHVATLPLVRHAYLFVDFFFVLSGFVIAASYRQRLQEGFGTLRFMWLRLGRLYPLHLFMLVLFIPIDLAKDGWGPHLLQAIGTNLAMLQGLGVNPQNWLNFPSWSISAEFAAYLVFALIISVSGRSLLIWFLFPILAPIILFKLAPSGMDSSFDFGFVRCLYGFALGVICYDLWERLPALRQKGSLGFETLLEGMIVAAILAFLSFADAHTPFSFFAPFLFAVLILIFACEGGLISRLLLRKPFLVLGTLTYSVYMLHAFIRAMSRAGLIVIEKLFDLTLFREMALAPGEEAVRAIDLFGSPLLGDLAMLAFASLTIAVSMLSYHFIELPGQAWARRRAKHLFAPKARGQKPVGAPAS
jgi:peptidoglycan/LPS O-acetylase OafA/YrhL